MKKSLIYITIFIVFLGIISVFLFKNKKTEIIENPSVPEVVEELDDKIIVEKYIRDNIKTIVPEKPVLGGSWYVTSVNINPSAKTGTMTYEDGHIQGSKSFSYVRNNNEVKINLTDSLLKEPVACTMDAKLCPDGSYVGRTGPNCEFVCP